jgi:hypothetical protein
VYDAGCSGVHKGAKEQIFDIALEAAFRVSAFLDRSKGNS